MDKTHYQQHSPTQYRPKGIWGAVLLPLDSTGDIDWSALQDELDILCESSLQGIYTNGTAGEFHNQTEDEYEKLTAIACEHALKASMPFQIGISHSNARIAKQRLQYAATLKPAAVQFTLPDWSVLSEYERQEFVHGLQDAGNGTPLVLYNPPHAKQRLTLSEIASLRKSAPSIIGAKLPGGDDLWYRERERLLPDFSVFVPGHFVAYGRPRGAYGSYSNVACMSPNGAVRHWQQIEEDPTGAQELEARTVQFMNESIVTLAHRDGLSNVALDKLLAAIGTWGPVDEKCLWPYRSATRSDVERLRLVARQQLPELFA